MAPGNKNDEDDTTRKTHTSDILNYAKLLFESATSDASTVFNLTALHSGFNSNLIPTCFNCFLLEYEDEIAYWYTSVISVACNWILGEDKEAECYYSKVENMPESLSNLNDPLPRAVLAAYTARKSYLSSTTIPLKTIYHQLEVASVLIEESLAYNSCKKQNNLVLVCDSN